MKKNDLIIHILGSLLVLSTLYHSYTLYSLLVVLPFTLLSYSVYREEERLLFPLLLIATLVSSLFIATESMNETFSVLVFSITFALPLFLYWIVVLLDETRIDWKPLGISLLYVLLTSLTFYFFPEFLEISEFLLSPENRAAQTLMFFGSGMIVAVPFHVILVIKD